jgi:hypothetical protein
VLCVFGVIRDGLSLADIIRTRRPRGSGLESHGPNHVPHQINGEIEVAILGVRKRDPLWGPSNPWRPSRLE